MGVFTKDINNNPKEKEVREKNDYSVKAGNAPFVVANSINRGIPKAPSTTTPLVNGFSVVVGNPQRELYENANLVVSPSSALLTYTPPANPFTGVGTIELDLPNTKAVSVQALIPNTCISMGAISGSTASVSRFVLDAALVGSAPAVFAFDPAVTPVSLTLGQEFSVVNTLYSNGFVLTTNDSTSTSTSGHVTTPIVFIAGDVVVTSDATKGYPGLLFSEAGADASLIYCGFSLVNGVQSMVFKISGGVAYLQ